MPISTGTCLGSYEVVAQIGAGGMGEVYKAHDTKLGRDVAVKVLPEAFAHDTERLSRFQREAKMLASLNHPNIATIHGLEHFNGTHYLVMELVTGETLADHIKREGAFAIEEALKIAVQIAEALEAAHEKGIIHRDLKPANVKLTPEGKVKVLDFGLAKAFAGDVADSNPSQSPTLSAVATMQGVLLGTAAYMSPEQARGKNVDKRTDIWAFGCVLYELLCGHPAFKGEDITEILAAVVKTEPDWSCLPESSPPAIRALLRRCLRKDKALRLRDAGDLRIEISDALSAPPTAVAATPVSVTRGWHEWVAWAVAAIAVVAALAALSFLHFREAPTQPQSIRLQMAPPERSVVSMFELSPDGRYVAFVALEGGRNRLWLRPLDTLQVQVMQGTDDANFPFWSPDSGFIGFFAAGKLKKIAVTGGPPQTLCDAPAGRGGAWNRDGVILFAPNLTGGLYRVSAAGGVPVQVTKFAPRGTGDSQRFPEFLPAGRRFLYLYISEAETTGIYVGSLDGTPPLRILPDLSKAVYAPPAAPGHKGYVLFRREATLMAQPFDPDRLQTTGEMFPVAEQVGSTGTVGIGAFSASENGVLSYRSGDVVGNRGLIWMDRAGKRLGTVTEPTATMSAALSPDEKRIALTINGATAGIGDIWLQDLGRGVLSRFTFETGYNSTPVWSPDGRHIAFSFRTAGTIYSIYQKDVTGNGKQEFLWHTGVNGFPSDWSPDGKFIVYSDYSDKTKVDLWLLPLQGEHKPIPYLQTPFDETHGQFSPDGRWMAYVSDESGRVEVYVQAIPASGGKWQISAGGGDFPRWRRDGKELFYIASDQKLMALPVKTVGTPTSAFEVGPPQLLFEVEPLGLNTFPYQPAADGQRFLVNAPAGGEAAAATPITVVLDWQAGLRK
jgi:eukaryotic-like serine/threonine-protein kinase